MDHHTTAGSMLTPSPTLGTVFSVLSIPADVKWYPVVELPCISLMAHWASLDELIYQFVSFFFAVPSIQILSSVLLNHNRVTIISLKCYNLLFFLFSGCP